MPDDGRLAPGPHPTPPAPWQREKFLELVRDTGMPEDIPQLCKTPPDPNLEHVHICRIDVPRKKRPSGMMIPCSFCTHGKPKFLDGHLMWSSDGQRRSAHLVRYPCTAPHGITSRRGMSQENCV